MTLESRLYLHPTRPNNPTVLEIAIYNCELKAKNYHNQRINNKDAQESMKRDYEHLQREKERIINHVVVQENLRLYRDNCENSTRSQ